MSTTDLGLIAVTDAGAAAGAIVWWRLAGDAPIERLEQAFEKHGLPEDSLPTLVAPTTALHRALADTFGRGPANAQHLVRTTSTGGRALVVEHRQADGALTYETALTATVDDKGSPVFVPADHKHAGAVAAHYERQLEVLSSHDIGSWLVRIIDAHDGVRLRDTGGVYFVPQAALPSWNLYTAAVHEATEHRCNAVPAMRSADAIASILDALQVETAAVVAALEEDLAAGPSARKARGRQRAAQQQIEKVNVYAAIVGAGAAQLATKLEDLRAQFAVAVLAGAAGES